MGNKICPYLGLMGDPKTVLEYPSDGNCCHRVLKVAQVRSAHQSSYCLTEKHLLCPLFLSDGKLSMPKELLGSSKKTPVNNWLKASIITAVILILGFSSLALLGRSRELAEQALLQPLANNAGDETQITGGSGIEVTESPSVGTSDSNQPGENKLTGSVCLPPPFWVIYIVKPTDSLVRLSLIYGVSVAQLQRANCLGDQILVRSGEELFVPGPTPTPRISATSTATITRTPRPFVASTFTPITPPDLPPPPTVTHTSPPIPTITPLPPTPIPTITETPLPTSAEL